jgi:hypothetical protein
MKTLHAFLYWRMRCGPEPSLSDQRSWSEELIVGMYIQSWTESRTRRHFVPRNCETFCSTRYCKLPRRKKGVPAALSYWRIVAELTPRDRHSRCAGLSKMDLIHSLEAEGGWEPFWLRPHLQLWLKTRWRIPWSPRSWAFDIIPAL